MSEARILRNDFGMDVAKNEFTGLKRITSRIFQISRKPLATDLNR